MKGNEQLIKEFLEHIKLGKPINNKKKKPVRERTIYKYSLWLPKISQWLNKSFEELTEEDMDLFRKKLSENKFKAGNKQNYSDSTKRDIEYKIFRQFLNWLGRNDLTLYTDNYKTEKEIPAITRPELERITAQCKLRDKLIFLLLFDSGARAEEFLNIKFSDVKNDKREDGYYKIRIRISKTKPRTISVPICTEVLDQWLSYNKDKIGSGEPLISISYTHLNMVVKRKAMQILKKHITPHTLRHSSATYYCHKLNQYQLCKRYGWSMASDMPKKYIDREGVDEEDMAEIVVNNEVSNYKEEAMRTREEMSLMKEELNEMRKKMLVYEEVGRGLKALQDKVGKSLMEELIKLKTKQ